MADIQDSVRDWVEIGRFKGYNEAFQKYQNGWAIHERYFHGKRCVRIDLKCREHLAKKCPLRIKLIRKDEKVVAFRETTAVAVHNDEIFSHEHQYKEEKSENIRKGADAGDITKVVRRIAPASNYFKVKSKVRSPLKMAPRRTRVLTRGGNMNMTARYRPSDLRALPPPMEPWRMKIRGNSRPQRVRGSPRRMEPEPNVTRFYNQPSSDSEVEADSGNEWTPSSKYKRALEDRQSSSSPRLRIALDEDDENGGHRPSSRANNNDPMSEGESGIGTQSQERSGNNSHPVSNPNRNGEPPVSARKTNSNAKATVYDGDMPTSLTLKVRKLELLEEVCDSMETFTKVLQDQGEVHKELLEVMKGHVRVMKEQAETQKLIKEQKDQQLQIMMEMLEIKKKKQASLDELVEIKKRKLEQLVERKQQVEISDAIRNFTIALSNEEMGGVPVTVNENMITVSVTQDSDTGDKEQEQVPSDVVDE